MHRGAACGNGGVHAVKRPVCGYTDHPGRIQAISVPVHANVHVVRDTEWCTIAGIAVVSYSVIAVVVARHGVVGITYNAPQPVVQVLHPGVGDHTAPLLCIVQNLIDAKADGVYVCVVKMCPYVMIHDPEKARAPRTPPRCASKRSYRSAAYCLNPRCLTTTSA